MAGIPESLTPILLRQQDQNHPDSNNLPPREFDFAVVETNGRFYIARPKVEGRCYQELLKPGTLVRIKSPDKMGKSLMMSRMLTKVSQNGYRTAMLDLRQANKADFSDINQFLLWFCSYLSLQLELNTGSDEDLNPRSEKIWKSRLSPNLNCTDYVKKNFDI